MQMLFDARFTDAVLLAGMLVCAGCATSQPLQPTDPPVVGVNNQVSPTVATVKRTSFAAGGVIGRIGYLDGVLTLDKGAADGIAVSQRVLICVREKNSLVRLCDGIVTPTQGGGMLKLNIRNVMDEDGDLIAQEFKTAPKRYLETHEVVAVACEMSSSGEAEKGELKDR